MQNFSTGYSNDSTEMSILLNPALQSSTHSQIQHVPICALLSLWTCWFFLFFFGGDMTWCRCSGWGNKDPGNTWQTLHEAENRKYNILDTARLNKAYIWWVGPGNIFLSHPAQFLLENQCFTKDFQWTWRSGGKELLCSFLMFEIHSWVLLSLIKGHLLVCEQLLMKSLIIQMTAIKSYSCAWIF